MYCKDLRARHSGPCIRPVGRPNSSARLPARSFRSQMLVNATATRYAPTGITKGVVLESRKDLINTPNASVEIQEFGGSAIL